MSIYLAHSESESERERRQDAIAAAAWAEALASSRGLAFAFLYMFVVAAVVLGLCWGYLRQDRVDAERERQHVEQLRRDGRLPAAHP